MCVWSGLIAESGYTTCTGLFLRGEHSLAILLSYFWKKWGFAKVFVKLLMPDHRK